MTTLTLLNNSGLKLPSEPLKVNPNTLLTNIKKNITMLLNDAKHYKNKNAVLIDNRCTIYVLRKQKLSLITGKYHMGLSLKDYHINIDKFNEKTSKIDDLVKHVFVFSLSMTDYLKQLTPEDVKIAANLYREVVGGLE